MIFKKYQFWLVLLCILQLPLYVVTAAAAGKQLRGAGGMFLYRFHNGDLEFLFVANERGNRVGFEPPGGTIGDHVIDQFKNIANPYSYLNGAIRETLEELISYPAITMQYVHHPTVKGRKLFEPKTKYPYSVHKNRYEVDTNYQQEAITFIKNDLLKNGLFYLYRTDSCCFFWNATAFTTHPKHNFLDDLVKKRIELGKFKNFFFGTVGAEPNAFAWVKAKDLLPGLNSTNATWVPVSEFAEYHNGNLVHIHNSKLQVQSKPIVDNKNKTIRLSEACTTLIADIAKRKYGLTQDAFILQGDTEYLLNNNKLTIQKTKTGHLVPSTMRGVIAMLTTQNLGALTQKGTNPLPMPAPIAKQQAPAVGIGQWMQP